MATTTKSEVLFINEYAPYVYLRTHYHERYNQMQLVCQVGYRKSEATDILPIDGTGPQSLLTMYERITRRLDVLDSERHDNYTFADQVDHVRSELRDTIVNYIKTYR